MQNRITYLRGVFRSWVNARNRKRLHNTSFSLICSNCTGCILLHELGLKYNSPFVNLWMKPKDFIKCVANLKEYMAADLKFIDEPGIDYPIGLLKDIKIYFQHYSSDAEALNKWNERKKRINYKNLFIMMTDRDGCTLEDIVAFNKLPYSNKIIFTHIQYPEIHSAFYIKGFETQNSVGMCFDFINTFSSKKYYDQFDYIAWFNKPCQDTALQ